MIEAGGDVRKESKATIAAVDILRESSWGPRVAFITTRSNTSVA
jgi:hypothetical protein